MKKIHYYFIFIIFVSSTRLIADNGYKSFIAFSLKVAKSELLKIHETEFRNKNPEIYNLGGITKPWMIVIDRENDDIILVGENVPNAPELTLDDFVVSLRSAFFSNPDEYPGVTIDLIPCDECIRKGNSEICSHSTKQEVKFFAGIDDTEFGNTCFEADLLLKKISFGIEKVYSKGFISYIDYYIKSLQDSIFNFVNSTSRDWFIPKFNVVQVVGDVILIEKMEMGVETELMNYEIDGIIVPNKNSLTDIDCIKAAESFTRYYNVISNTKPILKRLDSLCRLASLSKGLINISFSYDLRFWTSGYKIKSVVIDRIIDIIKVENKKYKFTLSGGVRLFSLVNKLKQGDSDALKELVMRTRPSSETLFWEYSIMLEDNQLKGIFIPDSTRLKIVELSPFLNRTNFILKRGRFVEAIKNYKMMIRSNPEFIGAYNGLGIAYRRINQLDSAEYYFNKSLKKDNNNAETYINIGALKLFQNKPSDAIEFINKSIEINPYLTQSYNNLGAAYRKLGDFKSALDCYNKSLEIDAYNYHAFTNRSMLHYHQMDYNLALSDINNAIQINPYLSEAYNVLGLIQVDGKHDYNSAIGYFTKAISIDPQTDYYINRAMAKANGLGKYKNALEDIDIAINLEGFGKAYAARATIYSYLGNYQDAIYDYKKAIELNYKEFEVYNNLSFIYEQNHNYDKAIKTLEKYIEYATNSNLQYNNEKIIDELNLRIFRLNKLKYK